MDMYVVHTFARPEPAAICGCACTYNGFHGEPQFPCLHGHRIDCPVTASTALDVINCIVHVQPYCGVQYVQLKSCMH